MNRKLLGTIGLGLLLVGCTPADQEKEIEELKKQVEEFSLEKQGLIETIEDQKKELEFVVSQREGDGETIFQAKAVEAYPQTLYKEMTLDLDGDGKTEIIELYVNAEKMENGSYAWDDGHKWLLVVKDGETTYPLFNSYVQLGSVDFSTATFDGEPGIVLHVQQHANSSVQKFIYNEEQSGYQKEIFYSKNNINDHYNQPAASAFFEDAYYFMETAFTTKTAVALEASKKALQDTNERAAIIEPIATDIENAQRLIGIANELNKGLDVTLDNVNAWLYELVVDSPTEAQMDQLKAIHNVFKEPIKEKLIDEEDNKLQPKVKERFDEIHSIIAEK